MIELKRGLTEREVVTQALDYGSWVQTLTRDDLTSMYAARHQGAELEHDFKAFFGIDLPDELVGDHRLLIVAAGIDDETERIVNYLAGFNVPINAVFFRYFEHEGAGLLARTWLRRPDDVEAVSSTTNASKRNLGPWNGTDYYVSFASNQERDWEDARRLGFVSAGGGRWYTNTLHNLQPGNRVFVRIPGEGYVGVGVVRETVKLAEEVTVKGRDGQRVALLQADLNADNMGHDASDHEHAEHVVLVDWLTTVARPEAYHEAGLFGNQNSACKLRDQNTIAKVASRFGIPEVTAAGADEQQLPAEGAETAEH